MSFHPNKTIDARINELIALLSDDQEVLAAFLFGSQARLDARSDSDIDICLVLMPHVNVKEQGFNKRLAYMSQLDLDVHIFQQIPLYIRQRVLKEGRIIFNRHEELVYEIAFKTIEEFSDYKYFYYDYLKEIERG